MATQLILLCSYVGPTLFIESISPGPHPELSLCLIHISQLTLCLIIFYNSLSPDFIFSAPKVTKLRTGLLRSWCSIPKRNKKYFSSAIGSQGLWGLPSLLVNRHGDSVQCVFMSWPRCQNGLSSHVSSYTFIAIITDVRRSHYGTSYHIYTGLTFDARSHPSPYNWHCGICRSRRGRN